MTIRLQKLKKPKKFSCRFWHRRCTHLHGFPESSLQFSPTAIALACQFQVIKKRKFAPWPGKTPNQHPNLRRGCRRYGRSRMSCRGERWSVFCARSISPSLESVPLPMRKQRESWALHHLTTIGCARNLGSSSQRSNSRTMCVLQLVWYNTN